MLSELDGAKKKITCVRYKKVESWMELPTRLGIKLVFEIMMFEMLKLDSIKRKLTKRKFPFFFTLSKLAITLCVK